MFKLEIATALPLMRQAYIDRRLGMQNGRTNCLNRYDGNQCCIIGAALPDDVANHALAASISYLRIERLIDVDFYEFQKLRNLQRAHDMVCTADQDGADRNERHTQFVTLFNELLTQHNLEPVNV